MNKYLDIVKKSYSEYLNYLKNEILLQNHWNNYFYGLVFIILLNSCSGTKRIVVSTPQKTIEVKNEEIVKDSINKKVIIVNEEINTKSNFKKTQKDSIPESIIPPKPLYTSVWNSLLQTYVSENGHVNYSGFKNDWSKLRGYINALGNNIPDEDWSKNETLAYWINAYNAMTIDLILRHYPVKSIKDIKNPWEQRLWKLGSKWYNLDEIEHQILRKMNEPRIHFAIVCASYSCPKLQNEAFVASKLESQLTMVTKAFLADKNRNELSENSLKISKIFDWFSKDFKKNGSLIDFLNQYSNIKISTNAKVKYKDYNWALNE